MTLVWIIISTLLISLLSLAGILSLAVKESWLNRILLLLVGFSAVSSDRGPGMTQLHP